ncbi:MAG: hypothetical protein ABIK09_17310 [Pseudomonadota bacterium]
MLRKLLAILLSITLFLAAFVVFIFLMIPVESITNWLQHKVNDSETIQLDIGGTERLSPGTIVLSDITLDLDFAAFRKARKRSEAAQDAAAAAASKLPGADLEAAPSAADEEPAKGGALASTEVSGFGFEPANGRLIINELELAFSPMDLLTPGAFSVEFRLDLMGGLIDDAELWFSSRTGYDKPRIFIGNIESLDMEQAPALSALFSAMFPYIRTDRLSGTVDTGSVLLEPVEVEAVGDIAEEGVESITKYVGEISISLMDVVARSPVFLLRFKKDGKKIAEEQFRLTDLKLGECDFVIKVSPPSEMKELGPDQRKRDGTAILFTKGVCSGESIDIALREKSYLRIPEKEGLKGARVDFWIKSAYSSEFFREEEKVDGVVVTQNKALDQAMRFKARGFQLAQDVDGYYWMHCVGPLTNASCKRQLPPEEKRRKQTEEERKQREKDAARKIENEKKEADQRAKQEADREARESHRTEGKPHVGIVSPPDKRPGVDRPKRPDRPEPESQLPPEDRVGPGGEGLDDEGPGDEGLGDEGYDDPENEGGEFDDEGVPLDEEPLFEDEPPGDDEGLEAPLGEEGEEGAEPSEGEEGEDGEPPLDEEIE